MKPEQITAWALEEASAEEGQQLEAELHENPQAKQSAEETKQFCHFLLAELRDESLALTDVQRERLKVQILGQPTRLPAASVTLAPRPKWRFSVVTKLAMAASIALGGLWTWHAFEPQPKPLQVALGDEVKYKVLPAGRGDLAVETARRSQSLQPAKSGKNETKTEALALDRLATVMPVLEAEPRPVEVPRSIALNGKLGTMRASDVLELKKIEDQQTYGLTIGGGATMPSTAPVAPMQGLTSSNQPSPATLGGVTKIGAGTLALNGGNTVTLSGANIYTGGTTINAGGVVVSNAATMPSAPAGATLDLSGSTRTAGNAVAFGNNTLSVGGAVSRTTVSSTINGTAASTPAAGLVVANPQPDAYYFTQASQRGGREKAGTVGKSRSWQELFIKNESEPASKESYTRILENELKDVAREPLSTLSIDVDTASYANVRRFLNQNTIPPADAVRIEELVNYFPTAEEGPAPQAKEPFAVRVELAPCPWQPTHRLARIAIKGRELGNVRKNSNLVFLVDVSGSMNEPSKLPLVQQSLRMLTEQLGEGDRVTMVVYAGSSGLVLPPTNGEKKADILAAIEKLQAGGSTHGSAGIQLAYEQAVAGFIKEGVNRVILCTDGDFNVGVSSPEELEKLISKKAKSGVFLSVLGFGIGNLKDRTMETLADKGNGNYAYIDSLSEARKVLVEQMSGTLVTIAKDVKIQVEFNPAAVRSYRLIGYENRLLAKEDFNDDTKDAGEIGAGHSVVALYEVVPANLPPGAEPRPAVDSLKYQTPLIAPAQLAHAAKSGELMTVKLRYKEPDSDLSKLIEVPTKDEGKTLTASSEEYKFSAAVAGFGLLLRDSAYKGTLSWETVRKLALDGKGADKLGYRGEFLQLIDKARGLKETRP